MSTQVLFLGWLLFAGLGPYPQTDPLDTAPFTGAMVCGKCHVDIYQAWQTNRHSRAATVPEFLQSLESAEGEVGDDARRFCLTCHAPTTVLTHDYVMDRLITKESVTCDFCHSMVESKPEERIPFELDVGDVKRGPYRDADSSEHGVAFSPLHVSAELCASCHEFTTPAGAPVLSTYTEYLESPYPRRSVPCQGCHMPIVMANVVDPKVKREPRAFINLHRMPGGHAVDQLQRALEMEWDEVRRTGGRLLVRVALSNVAAGHRVPTGLPTRKLILEVEAQGPSGRTDTDRMVFEKVVVDESGRRLLAASDVFLRAARIQRDNRIHPGEKRVAGFTFNLPSTEKVELAARLVMELAPLGPTGETERITFSTIRREVP